jgi:hypothetical protein
LWLRNGYVHMQMEKVCSTIQWTGRCNFPEEVGSISR